MQVRIWGCRGSLSTPGPTTVGYGGNTTSVEARTDSGALVVLDAGTGIRSFGASLGGAHPERIDLLLTHLHLDHVEGLGFFAPLFDETCAITIWGPPQEGTTLEARLAEYLSPPWFPVPYDKLPATIDVREVWEDTWQLDGLVVRSKPVQHPGPTVGYRLESPDRSLAFVPDNEPALDRSSGVELAAGADVLLHDAQYTESEYVSRVGWGHSALPDFARLVREAQPGRVLMFHHDPAHDDAFIDRMRDEAAELAGREVEVAREGLLL